MVNYEQMWFKNKLINSNFMTHWEIGEFKNRTMHNFFSPWERQVMRVRTKNGYEYVEDLKDHKRESNSLQKEREREAVIEKIMKYWAEKIKKEQEMLWKEEEDE